MSATGACKMARKCFCWTRRAVGTSCAPWSSKSRRWWQQSWCVSPNCPIRQNEFRLSVSGRDGLTLVAAIRPTEITTTYVSGQVEWIGADPPARFIRSIGEETYWRQYLTLVFAAAGPHSAPDVSVFQANQWASAELTLPDFLGEPGDVVRVSVHSHDWKAQLSVTCQPELTAEAEIPRGLRKLDAVTTVIEMTARIFLGRSWLTLELIPQ